jgi:hypothetical protein
MVEVSSFIHQLLIAIFKIVGTAAIPLLLGAVVAAKLQKIVSHSFLDRLLRFFSRCVLLIISEVPIPLSKQYYQIVIFHQFFCKINGL